MLEALEMLKAFKSGEVLSEEEISEMIDNLRDRGKELEHKIELSYSETIEEQECGELLTNWKNLYKREQTK